MLDEGASYDDVRERYGVPASTLRRYKGRTQEQRAQNASL